MGGDDLGDEQWMLGDGILDSINDDSTTENDDHTAENHRKRKVGDEGDKRKSPHTKQAKTPEKLLIEAGRHLESQNANQLSCFLNAALSHYCLLAQVNEKEIKKLEPVNFKTSSQQSLVDRLSDAMSLKKIRKWKHIGSPCVVSDFNKIQYL
jgi:hypothetical protein